MTRDTPAAITETAATGGNPCLHIVVHDFSGHAFTAQLARELARRGNRVDYVSCAAFASPKGDVGRRPDDPSGFRAHPLGAGGIIDKDNLLRRFRQERTYGALAARFVAWLNADVVLSANAPIPVQRALARAASRSGAAFVAWVQDLHADAIGALLGKRHRVAAPVLSFAVRRAERAWLRSSDGIVLIDEAFRERLGDDPWRLALPEAVVIPNWSAMPVAEPAALSGGAGRRPVLVYAGTLARKHDPALLLALAAEVDADLRVHAEGSNADWLAAEADRRGLRSLHVLPWADAQALPAVLAEADVLVAVLDPVATDWSIPSKILTYMAAGRPTLAAIPAGNPAARLLSRTQAGLVVEPTDQRGFVEGARRLIGDAGLRDLMGHNGQRHARAAFAIGPIAAAFEAELRRAIERRASRSGAANLMRDTGRLRVS